MDIKTYMAKFDAKIAERLKVAEEEKQERIAEAQSLTMMSEEDTAALFQELDTNNDNKLSQTELKSNTQKLGELGVTSGDLKSFFSGAGFNVDNYEVEFQRFEEMEVSELLGMTIKEFSANALNPEGEFWQNVSNIGAQKLFEELDLDGDKMLSCAELVVMSCKNGDGIHLSNKDVVDFLMDKEMDHPFEVDELEIISKEEELEDVLNADSEKIAEILEKLQDALDSGDKDEFDDELDLLNELISRIEGTMSDDLREQLEWILLNASKRL